MFRTVTVGLDGSPESLAAADWAAREARLRAAVLRAVYAGEQQPSVYVPFAGEAVAQPDEDRTERMLREVRASLTHRHPGLDVTAERLAGRPAAALVEAAGETDLLVIGSRGLGRAAGHLLGSVASAVTGRADGPVVLVRAGAEAPGEHRPDADGTPSAATPYRDVVLGVELADRTGDAVLEFAFDAARRRATGLRVVHGRRLPSHADTSARPEDGPESLLRPWREKFPDVEVTEEAVVGHAGPHLVDASRDASLIVIGRRNRRSATAARQVGPVTQEVLRHAVAPVAVVPHD
ncbi:universal stress protein [Streptomyces sp. NPDC000987]|uniref:universal stress protein n=1 Tax=Streptomyces sp. NPDC000987 TaxID=3154374 RepID=UPI0033322989